MIYRQLGNTGLSVSTIALGCEGFVGKSSKEVKNDFDFAIENGINFVDIYSSDPNVRANIGNALNGHRNNFVFQAHLCTAWEKEQYLRTRDIRKTKKSFESLLDNLCTDYLDIGMIHYIDDERDFHRVFDGNIYEYAQQLKQEGRIHNIGISSHNPAIAKMAVESGYIDVLMFSINPCYDMQPPTEVVDNLWADESYSHEFHNIDPDRESLYELCEGKGVGIDVMKVYGGGDLLSEENSPFGKALTPAQCIEYALTRPAVAAIMVGCHNSDEIRQALTWCSASEFERDYSIVLSHLEKFTWQGHCMYCGHCAPCTVGIDIASVNKYYNLTVAERIIPETVANHYKLLSHHAYECIKCGHCEKNCPFGVHIIESMQNATAKFGY